MKQLLNKILNLRLSVYRYIFYTHFILSIKSIIVYNINILWKIILVILWVISFMNKYLFIKEISLLLLVAYFFLYWIERESYEKIDKELYIIYVYIILNSLIIIIFFLDFLQNIF